MGLHSRHGLPPTIWAGHYIPGDSYEGRMMTLDEGWLAVSRRLTDQKPAPELVGSPAWGLPDSPTWTAQQENAPVIAGIDVNIVEPNRALEISRVRFWAPSLASNILYEVYTVVGTDYQLVHSATGDTLGQIGWQIIPTQFNRIVLTGAVFQVVLSTRNTQSTTEGTYHYQYEGSKSGNDDPGEGKISRNGGRTVLRISDVDYNKDDPPEVHNITVGSVLRMTERSSQNRWEEYNVIAPKTDNGNWYNVPVEHVDSGSQTLRDNEIDLRVINPASLPVDYVELTDGYLNTPNARGVVRIGDGPITNTDDAYGVDIETQELVVSPDWDLIAATG